MSPLSLFNNVSFDYKRNSYFHQINYFVTFVKTHYFGFVISHSEASN